MTPGETGHEHERPSLATGVLQILVRETVRAPLVALSLGLQAWERVRQLRDTARRRGDEALQIAAHTPLGRLLPREMFGDDAEAEGRRIAEQARQTVTRVAKPPEREAPARQRAGQAAQKRAVAASPQAREAGAPGVATDRVEDVARRLSVAEPVSREELPIPDFDNVSLASLRARLRSLSLEQLLTLREWEQAHAHRLAVITLLDNRISKLSADQPGSSSSRPAPSGPPASGAGPGGDLTTGSAARAADSTPPARDDGGTLPG